MDKAIIWLTGLAMAMILGITAPAAAAQRSTILALPDTGMVMLWGTVQKISDDYVFILRDDSGSVSVHMPADNAAILGEGDSVIVIGVIDYVGQKIIHASQVQVDQDFAQLHILDIS